MSPFRRKRIVGEGQSEGFNGTGTSGCILPRIFTFDQLVSATKNFSKVNFLGEGGFGRVYRGDLEDGQVVSVKRLNRNGYQGNAEFQSEIYFLSKLHHPNIIKLIGFCNDGHERLIVYEFMPLRSLDKHLHGLKPSYQPLDWNTRMKIAAGAAESLEYLHKEQPPVIFQDFKSANILLDGRYHPKLSDFGLAKDGPGPVSASSMGTEGYYAPERLTGLLTVESDVYSFGVVLLELITGCEAWHNREFAANIVVERRFKNRKCSSLVVDVLLKGQYPEQGLYLALSIAEACLHRIPTERPSMTFVASEMKKLASEEYAYKKRHQCDKWKATNVTGAIPEAKVWGKT